MLTATRSRPNIFELQDLEVRRFLAVSATIGASNTLIVTGSDSSETIEFRLSGSNVTVAGKTFTPGSTSGRFNKISVDARGGNDVIKFDQAITSYISATLKGGTGNDNITSGAKADLIQGDSGFDTANYSARSGAVRVSLDGTANDGANSGAEGDNVQTEEVLGGSGADIFTGGSGDDFFGGGAGKDTGVGNAGNDELVGSTGSDNLQGKDGDDSLYAKNNDNDSLNGGTNTNGTSDLDLAEIDAGLDTTLGLSTASRGLVSAAIDPALLDTLFGGNGTGTNSGPDFDWDEITAATVDSQGRTIIVGYAFTDDGTGYGGDTDFAVMRYDANGLYDEDFGEVRIDFGGGYGDDDFAYGVTTDSDDNIIVVGSTTDLAQSSFDRDFAIARLTSAGIQDESFGNNGLLRVDIMADSLGGGEFDEAVDAVVQADDNIVVFGQTNIGEGSSDYALLRLTPEGFVDGTFNGNGMVVRDFGYDRPGGVALQALPEDEGSQRIIIVGRSDDDALLARFLADGSDDGAITANPSPGNNIALYNDVTVNDANEIFAVGQTYPINIITLVDPTPNAAALGMIAKFDADAVPVVFQYEDGGADAFSFNAVAFDEGSGNIVAVGTDGNDYAVARYSGADLSADSSFNEGDPVYTDIIPVIEGSLQDVALGVGVLADGKIIAAGYTDGFDGIVTSVARFGLDDGNPFPPEVEGLLTFDDVNSAPTDRRSGTATFYLRSTHLDDQGRAFIDLTNNNDNVSITKITTEDGIEQVRIDVDGVVLYYDLDTTLITIYGKNGNDSILATDDVPIPLRIYGDNGNDRLGGGGGNDLVDGGNGNDVITGGAGHDVLLGGGNGSDNLSGGIGNDILIGGNGGDSLLGQAGEDILIGGTTAHDNDPDALESISAEWRSGDATTNAARISNLRLGGGLNGTNVLKIGAGATVFDDGIRDQLTGGSERDWFFRRNTGSSSARDSILDDLAGEEVDTF